MKIVVIAHRSEQHTAEQFAPLLQKEADRALQLFADEVFRELYSRRDGKGAVIVMEAENEEAARAVLDTLPLVEAGMLHYETYPLTPYRGIVAMVKK